MEKKYENDEVEIDLKALFFELLNNWIMIVVSAVLVAAIAFCMSKFLTTPMYQSTSELYVLSKSTSITSIADIQVGTYMEKDYVEVVTGRPVLEQVIENLGLEENYKQLGSKVSISNPDNTRILQITVTDADPERAKMITDEIAEVASAFIAEKMDQEAPNIISYGYADGGVINQNIQKNTILGGLIGAFLAIAIVVISYLMNDTIMSAEDVERKLGLNVLGTLPLEEDEYNGKKRISRKAAKAAAATQTTGKQSKK